MNDHGDHLPEKLMELCLVVKVVRMIGRLNENTNAIQMAPASSFQRQPRAI